MLDKEIFLKEISLLEESNVNIAEAYDEVINGEYENAECYSYVVNADDSVILLTFSLNEPDPIRGEKDEDKVEVSFIGFDCERPIIVDAYQVPIIKLIENGLFDDLISEFTSTRPVIFDEIIDIIAGGWKNIAHSDDKVMTTSIGGQYRSITKSHGYSRDFIDYSKSDFIRNKIHLDNALDWVKSNIDNTLMIKNQIIEQLTGTLTDDQLDRFSMVFKGHVWEMFPQFEESGYFFRSVVFEGQIDGETFKAVYFDRGNQHLDFECLAGVEEMTTYLEQMNPGVVINA